MNGKGGKDLLVDTAYYMYTEKGPAVIQQLTALFALGMWMLNPVL